MTPYGQYSVPLSPATEETLVALGSPGGQALHRILGSARLLQALYHAGTSHIYADTADVQELEPLIAVDHQAVISEIDGNTANQPLVHKVLTRYLDQGDARQWAKDLRAKQGQVSEKEMGPLLYTVICGRIGNDVVRAVSSGRNWEVSLQLHMSLIADMEAAKQMGRCLRRMVPSAFVKVPFAPHMPQTFLIARDLERDGIPVNFTSTFSVRQAVAAALLADVTRTNIFMGRLDQGLRACLLGAHVDLEAQRALLSLRRSAGIKTQLIVASMRDWRTFLHTAGCDVYTAPCGVIQDFLIQTEVSLDDIPSQLGTSYEASLGIPNEVMTTLGHARIAGLYHLDQTFVEFLTEYGRSDEYRGLQDGERLARRFEDAGFGDVFHSPDEGEWAELRRTKIPDLNAPITSRLPLDTLYSLMADADFATYQDEMDREIA